MTTVGFIGAGHIGGTVARLALAAGNDVGLSNSRTPRSLGELVEQLGPHARAGTPTEAATVGEFVVVSIPLRAYTAVPVEPLVNKTVLDTCNYYPARDGQIAVLDNDSMTSSELLGKHLIGAHIVKVFNNIFFKHLASLARPADRRRRRGGQGHRHAVPRRHRLRRGRRRAARRRRPEVLGRAGRLWRSLRRLQRRARHSGLRRGASSGVADPRGRLARFPPQAQAKMITSPASKAPVMSGNPGTWLK